MSVLIVCCRSWISCPENKADTTYHLVVVGGGGGTCFPSPALPCRISRVRRGERWSFCKQDPLN